jgi:hypothetical protein
MNNIVNKYFIFVMVRNGALYKRALCVATVDPHPIYKKSNVLKPRENPSCFLAASRQSTLSDRFCLSKKHHGQDSSGTAAST